MRSFLVRAGVVVGAALLGSSVAVACGGEQAGSGPIVALPPPPSAHPSPDPPPAIPPMIGKDDAGPTTPTQDAAAEAAPAIP